ncbi:MAG TPA: hypothetical protein VIK56_16865 [Rhodoferax sp.]
MDELKIPALNRRMAFDSLDLEPASRTLGCSLLARRAGEFFGERQQALDWGAVNVVERLAAEGAGWVVG